MMKWARRAAACVLVGLYGALAGALLAGAATFFFYGLGALVGIPVGFVLGAALGWYTPLRDALILAAGTVGTLAASLWLCFPLGFNPSYALLASPLVVLLWGGAHALIRTRVGAVARYGLALFLVLACAFNVVMVSAIHS